MFVVDKGLTPVRLEDDRVAYLDEHELKLARIHVKCGPAGTSLASVVATMAEFELEDLDDTKRRYAIVRMAVHGEFGGIARQLKLWGIEPAE